jgi:hypothetical protein
MQTQWERKPVWRHSVWQVRSPAAPQRWPLKLSVLLLTGLCIAAWVLLGGALHVLYSAVG